MSDFKESIIKIARLRQIIASAKGKIGLYWLSKDFNNIIPTDVQTLADNTNGLNTIPENLVVVKGHKKAWEELDKEIIKQNGGNSQENGWRSLPRGFVGYSTKQEKFFILGGKWLNKNIADKIAKTFNINEDYEIIYFPDYDNIKWEDNW